MKKAILLIVILFAAGCIGSQQNQNNTYTNETMDKEASEVNYSVSYSANYTAPAPGFDYTNYSPPDVQINHTLLIKFPIVKSPMHYYVYNDTEINYYKYNLTLVNIRTAFDAWENATKFRVRFYRVEEKPINGIVIHLVTNLSGDTIGEARPLGRQYASYSVVTGGEMTLEPTFGGSENLVQIMHEIGHIMGLGHSKDPHSIMYPWNAYSQVITKDIVDALDTLYHDVPVITVTT
ncbi:MAG: matrixin family metalloprotease [Candidatus Aenigmarchaeota archaeon]|nr:matrixin family metalloprotease [Candidatus Aenigmarchaeota archaeon]